MKRRVELKEGESLITYKDLKWFWNLLNTEEEVNLVVNYLREGNKTILLSKTHCSQSGWSGENVYLDGRDLSGNGYNFNAYRLMEHVRGFGDYEKLRETDEYKQYLLLKDKFKNIDKIFG